MACLLADDPNPDARAQGLAEARDQYRWDHVYLDPLPMLKIDHTGKHPGILEFLAASVEGDLPPLSTAGGAVRRKATNAKDLCCSFCGKSQKEVRKLIAGPSVYICDECIALCNDILAEEVQKEERQQGQGKVPKPKEIRAILDDYVRSRYSSADTEQPAA